MLRLGSAIGAGSAQAQAPAAAKVTIAESAGPNSNVSIAVEPTLSDGRLIVRIAVQNHSAAAVALGPGNVSIAKAKGGPIALIPLQRLIEEVDIAAGGPATASHAGSAAYDAPILPVNSEGRVDVSGYTGGTSVAPDERLRRSRSSKAGVATISRDEADKQIGVLKAAILRILRFRRSRSPPGKSSASH